MVGAIGQRLLARGDDQAATFDARIFGPVSGIILQLAIVIPAHFVGVRVPDPFRRVGRPVDIELVGPDKLETALSHFPLPRATAKPSCKAARPSIL
jgi:hypothetical protein